MSWHSIGEISLDIATLIYFIWFIPQLRMTFKRKSTEGLSLWMHGFLIAGYLADLVYGFGRELPVQYRIVTIVGLLCLVCEHFQFWRYGLKTSIAKKTFYLFNVVFISFLVYTVATITVLKETKFFYDMAGMISNICWFVFFIPQIVKNYRNKSSKGLSTSFVVLSLFTTMLDTISTYALGYPWPSKIGIPVTLFKKSLLISQCYYYRSRDIYRYRDSKQWIMRKIKIG